MQHITWRLKSAQLQPISLESDSVTELSPYENSTGTHVGCIMTQLLAALSERFLLFIGFLSSLAGVLCFLLGTISAPESDS